MVNFTNPIHPVSSVANRKSIKGSNLPDVYNICGERKCLTFRLRRLAGSKLKIYGRLDCPSALSTIKRFPGSYEKVRVFFADEKTALVAGYRPCGNCLRAKYKQYKENEAEYKAQFGL